MRGQGLIRSTVTQIVCLALCAFSGYATARGTEATKFGGAFAAARDQLSPYRPEQGGFFLEDLGADKDIGDQRSDFTGRFFHSPPGIEWLLLSGTIGSCYSWLIRKRRQRLKSAFLSERLFLSCL